MDHQFSVWIIEYRLSGTSRWRIAEMRTTKEVAERWVSKKHTYNTYEFRVVEYRRIEPAPGDSGAGEGK